MESRLVMLCGSLPPPPGKRTPTFPLFRLHGPQNGQSEAPSSFTMTGEGCPVTQLRGPTVKPLGLREGAWSCWATRLPHGRARLRITNMEDGDRPLTASLEPTDTAKPEASHCTF